MADKNFSVTFQETGTWYELLKDNEALNVSSTTQTIAVPAHEFRLFTNFKPTLTGIEAIAPDAEKLLIYYNRGIDTLVLPGGEAKTRRSIFCEWNAGDDTGKNVLLSGLSALARWLLYGTGLYGRGRVQVCKIMK